MKRLRAAQSDSKTDVLLALSEKSRGLMDSEKALEARLAATTDVTERGLLKDAIRKTVNEGRLVDARFTAIKANGPFKMPTKAQEQALVDAIQEVGRLANLNGAIVKLVKAALDLVAAYKAEDTKKAAA